MMDVRFLDPVRSPKYPGCFVWSNRLRAWFWREYRVVVMNEVPEISYSTGMIN